MEEDRRSLISANIGDNFLYTLIKYLLYVCKHFPSRDFELLSTHIICLDFLFLCITSWYKFKPNLRSFGLILFPALKAFF